MILICEIIICEKVKLGNRVEMSFFNVIISQKVYFRNIDCSWQNQVVLRVIVLRCDKKEYNEFLYFIVYIQFNYSLELEFYYRIEIYSKLIDRIKVFCKINIEIINWQLVEVNSVIQFIKRKISLIFLF